MDIQELKKIISEAMPLLSANLDAGYKEWMSGSLARGAFAHIQSRIDIAQAVLVREDIKPELAYQACAMITIDLRSAVEDAGTVEAEKVMGDWVDCFQKAGYTETNPIFDIPALPAACS